MEPVPKQTPSEWLAARTPQQVEAQLVSLAQSLGLKLHADTRLAASYDKSGAFLGSSVVPNGWVAEGPVEALEDMAGRIEASLVPAPVETVEIWLAELSCITARRADSEADADLRLAAYRSRLMEYPADVVRAALLNRRWHWWPTWAELADACDDLMGPRKAMAEAVDRARWEAMRASSLPAPGQHSETPDEASARRRRMATAMHDVLGNMRAAE